MNKGVEILLARIDSHPQEFCHESMHGRYGRWSTLVGLVLTKGSSFTDEEREAVDKKLNLLAREQFTQDVMRKLLEGPEEGPVLTPYGVNMERARMQKALRTPESK